MPKVVDYPRRPLKQALDLAEAVDGLGGSCTPESAADGVGMKVGGAFQALVGAAVKYGLVESRKGRISVTPLFRKFKLAYSDAEATAVKRTAFTNVPLFAEIISRFAGTKIPLSHFDRLLIREHAVPDEIASRVAGYFLDGAKAAGVLDDNGTINATPTPTPEGEPGGEPDADSISSALPAPSALPEKPSQAANVFRVRVTGPGIDSSIELQGEDDLAILDVMLNKIRKRLMANAEN